MTSLYSAQSEQADLASVDLTAPLRPTGSSMPRWQRKQLAASSSNASSSKAPSSATKRPRASSKSSLSLSSSVSSSLSSSASSSGQGDRFIPKRSSMDLDQANFRMTTSSGPQDGENAGPANESDEVATSAHTNALSSALLGSEDGARVLAFKNKAPAPAEGYESSLRALYTQNKGHKSTRGSQATAKSTRYIPSMPEKILDAPDLLDDYYLNLLDWSVGNVLAVALGPTVYL